VFLIFLELDFSPGCARIKAGKRSIKNSQTKPPYTFEPTLEGAQKASYIKLRSRTQCRGFGFLIYV